MMSPWMLWMLWMLAPVAVVGRFVLGMITSAINLHRSHAADSHFVSARALLQPTSPPRPVRPVGDIARPPDQSTQMETSERVVLATSYLRAVAAGDQSTRKAVLSVSSNTDLIAGLTLVNRMLTDEFGGATGQSSDAVLQALHERALTRHWEIVVLA